MQLGEVTESLFSHSKVHISMKRVLAALQGFFNIIMIEQHIIADVQNLAGNLKGYMTPLF